MLYSYNWLSEYLSEIPPPEDLAHQLTMAGVEVESLRRLGAGIKGVVTAKILTREPHPNADRLSLCTVTTGGEEHQIVCGATNMKPGDAVALALPGAVLPGGFKIKKSKIRGVVSGGMMCSGAELGMEEESEGILILPPETPLGMDIREVLGLDDVIFEISITPNRGDVLSIKGLAREIAAITGADLVLEEEDEAEETPPASNVIDIDVEDAEACPRYTAMVIEGVKVGPSPDFIASRLVAHGMRPVNNIVDITNYILLELGQPMHAFDLSKIRGRVIRVRTDRKNETITTIDKTEIEFEGNTALVIADAQGPVAVGGIMGGQETAVSETTTRVLLESAFFDPLVIRRASKALGLSSDSSYRFERGVDIDCVRVALVKAAAMILDVAGGRATGGVIDIYPVKFTPPDIEFNVKKASASLGMDLDKDTIIKKFTRLGIDLRSSEKNEDVLLCSPPSYRTDITARVDLLEEAARLLGYDLIPTAMPLVTLGAAAVPPEVRLKNRIKHQLTSLGLTEVVNYSFVSEDVFSLFGGSSAGVAILNPLSEDHGVLRGSLMPGLLKTLETNLARGASSVHVFELGPVFHAGLKGPVENWKVAGLIYGERSRPTWNSNPEPVDFFDIKGIIEALLDELRVTGKSIFAPYDGPDSAFFHPGRSALLRLGTDDSLAVLGELHPSLTESLSTNHRAYLFEMDLKTLSASISSEPSFTPLPRYPASTRDLAIVVDKAIPCDKIVSVINEINTKLIESVDLFDVYYGKELPSGTRSLAFRIRYRSPVKTLTHQEVEKAHSRLVSALTRRFNATVRGE